MALVVTASTDLTNNHVIDGSCFEPVGVNKLSEKQRRQAGNLLFLVTEKRDASIEGEKMADGGKQRLGKTKKKCRVLQ